MGQGLLQSSTTKMGKMWVRFSMSRTSQPHYRISYKQQNPTQVLKKQFNKVFPLCYKKIHQKKSTIQRFWLTKITKNEMVLTLNIFRLRNKEKILCTGVMKWSFQKGLNR